MDIFICYCKLINALLPYNFSKCVNFLDHLSDGIDGVKSLCPQFRGSIYLSGKLLTMGEKDLSKQGSPRP